MHQLAADIGKGLFKVRCVKGTVMSTVFDEKPVRNRFLEQTLVQLNGWYAETVAVLIAADEIKSKLPEILSGFMTYDGIWTGGSTITESTEE